MGFKVLYLKEHEELIPTSVECPGNNEKVDTQIIILYDPEDSNLYYYGKRNYLIASEYSGTYARWRISEMADFLDFILGNLIITSELHDIDIAYSEYNDLSFTTLLKKLGKNTELAAYDRQQLKKKNIYNICKMLITE
jgi:hypothetical protein